MKHHLRRTILIASVVFYGLSAWAYAYNAPSVPHAPTAYSDALDHTTRHSYNAAGQIAQQTAFDGATTTWQYGASGANAGRLLKLLRPDGSSQELAYDSYGRVNRHTDTRDGTETLTLDSLGRTTRQDLSHPAAQLAGSSNYSATTQYQWDAVGNRSQLRIASPNRDINASWDAAGQLQTLTSIEGGDNHFSFDAAGRLAQIERSDGSTSSYQYNAAGQLIGIHHKDANDQTLTRFDYTLNQNGQRTQAVETIHAAGQSTERTVTWHYDNAGKLTQETIAQTLPSVQNIVIAYSYDLVGNRSSRTISGSIEQTTTYTYDANDRLTQEVDSIHGTTTYQYDTNGNLTQKTSGASTTTYSWNSDNRLIEVQTGSTTIRYGYDPQGRRIKRLKTEGSDKEETHYILDTQRAYHDIVIKRTRRNSDPWQETSYLFTPDGIGAPLSQHNGTDTTQIYADGQGSTRLTLDGISAHAASYDAFGIRLHGSASTTHGYTGEQQDEDTGLIYLRARDYDPRTGRFISMDEHPGSQRIPLTLNKYLYGNADPVNHVDPSGYMLISLSINMNTSSMLRMGSLQQGRSVLARILIGRPPKDIGIAGELILNWVTEGVFGVLSDVDISDMSKQEFGRRVHKRVKDKCAAFPGFNGITISCEPFFDKHGPTKNNRQTKGSLGVDLLIRYHGKPVIAIELKTGRGMSKKGFGTRKKWIGTDVVQITIHTPKDRR